MKEIVRLAEAGFGALEVDSNLQETASQNLATWLETPYGQESLAQIEHLVEQRQFGTLFDAFFRQIPFGTGGRRGPVGYGTNRINAATIATSIQGHAEFIRQRFPNRSDLSVVVAFDVRVFQDLRGVYDPSRPHPLLGATSKNFACIAASVYAANGIKVWLPKFDGSCISTPELSFAIRFLGSCGGLNVSASHNHPDDNGAKIYNDRGSQEIPPLDEELARIVEATTETRSMPFAEAVGQGMVQWLSPDCYEAYLRMNVAASRRPEARSARVVFTPLHGTGYHSAGAVLERAQFPVELFEPQASQDGTFPGVPFRSPNPEVPQSLEAAAAAAKERAADLVLGTDPDADRIGMMAPHGDEWVFFTGNEIGLILVQYLLIDAEKRVRGSGHPFAVTTVVTTSLFGKICRSQGVEVIDDLGVGFKYIADIMNLAESEGGFRGVRAGIEDFVLGIEESHGYLIVPDVRDKDAAGAALLLAELASVLKQEGRSFVDYLNSIYLQHGYVRNVLVSTIMLGATGFTRMRKIQQSLRDDPPAQIGGRRVLECIDRWDESGPLGKIVSETDRTSRDLITFQLEGGARLTLRPSGTESKNKIYVEVCGESLGEHASSTALEEEKCRIDAAARELAKAFTREMLARIEISLPDFALEISDLVPLECKVDFATTFMPELKRRLTADGSGTATGAWIDEHLKSYGADARLLVRPAVAAYIASEAPDADVKAALEGLFGLD